MIKLLNKIGEPVWKFAEGASLEVIGGATLAVIVLIIALAIL